MNTFDESKTHSLLEELENTDKVKQRRAAAYKLGKLRDPEAVPALIEATKDVDSIVGQNAINALHEINSDEARNFLKTVELTQRLHTSAKPANLNDLWLGASLFIVMNVVFYQARGYLFGYLHEIGSPLWGDVSFDNKIYFSIFIVNMAIFIFLMRKRPSLGIGMLAGIPIGIFLFLVFVFVVMIIQS